MPQSCTACTHPDRHAIDVAIVAGIPNRRVAAQFGLTEAAVRRHRVSHLPAQMARARDAAELANANDLVAQVPALQARALAILDAADAAGDHRTALSAMREARGALQLVAQLTGELRERVEIVDDTRAYVAEWGSSPTLPATPAAQLGTPTTIALPSPTGTGTATGGRSSAAPTLITGTGP